MALFSISKQKTFMDNYSRDLNSTLIEAKIICSDLEEMMENAVNISKSIVEEIDNKIININTLNYEDAIENEHININSSVNTSHDNNHESAKKEFENDIKNPVKIRIYELAKELNISNKELVSVVKGLGINVSNHMNALDETQIQMVKDAVHSAPAIADKFNVLLQKELIINKDVVDISELYEQNSDKNFIESYPNTKPKLEFSMEDLKQAHPYIAVRTLHENGYPIRDIAKMLDRGQGEISLILSLSKKKQVI